ncbi:unnamed protein product [Clonostachys solani]|uniref:A to I editase domain-containing protein n=1 Tax=Clonostachys solani TaxID=160281 RepID=A0A9N9VX23_9HYPO|nr:unnamed protein product [Clonostachys solani]
MASRANRIALAVLNEFNKLPAKRKPLVRDNGLHEWVPLSGIVAEKDGNFQCLALATGMKCLPASKLPDSHGVGIHDWHAEVLAIRTFNRFLLDECHSLRSGESQTKYISPVRCSPLSTGERGNQLPFAIGSDVKLHMYCSEAPCGDASMELTMAAQESAAPWDVPDAVESTGSHDPAGSLPGRAYFSQLGIVRRKPARGDAPPTLSKSCSDKISLKQCTSLLSSITSLFINPINAYIDTMVLPRSQFSESGCRRAFSRHGRMKALDGAHWPGGYSFKPFNIETTDLEFAFSKKTVSEKSSKVSASNLAAAWSLSGVEETIIGGVIQGRKPFDARGASQMSRREMWLKARSLASNLEAGHAFINETLQFPAYREVKESTLLAVRRKVKQDVQIKALTGWQKNDGDSDFNINQIQ